MRLLRFRVKNYRCILDSGVVHADSLMAVVGPNEAGKTSLLRALHKLNPAVPDERFDIGREWPIRHWGDQDPSFFPIVAVFELDADEKTAFRASAKSGATLASNIVVARAYDGALRWEWDTSEFVDSEHCEMSAPACEGEEVDDQTAAADAQEDAGGLETRTFEPVLPSFVYMDEYRPFRGHANLNELLQHRQESRLTEEEATVDILLALSGLAEEQLRTISQSEDPHHRRREMEAAARRLTESMAGKWSQGDKTIRFNIDGPNLTVTVEDNDAGTAVPLEDRSTGFQWFFSFDMLFSHGTSGEMKGAVLLLDEPGIRLHGDGQQDMLRRFEHYAHENQIIYTTHLPFMLSMEHPERLRAMVRDASGWRVAENLAEADPNGMQPIHMALGFSSFQSLMFGPRNLVVEGIEDMWMLLAMSHALQGRGLAALPDIVITFAGGAQKVPYMCNMLKCQKLKVAALLDGDSEGQGVYNQLVQTWSLPEDFVTTTDSVAQVKGSTLEDLVDRSRYVAAFNSVFSKSLSAPVSVDDLDPAQPILSCIKADLKKRKETGIKGNFNHATVIKRIVADIGAATPESLEQSTVDNFGQLFRQLDRMAQKWKTKKN